MKLGGWTVFDTGGDNVGETRGVESRNCALTSAEVMPHCNLLRRRGERLGISSAAGRSSPRSSIPLYRL